MTHGKYKIQKIRKSESRQVENIIVCSYLIQNLRDDLFIFAQRIVKFRQNSLEYYSE